MMGEKFKGQRERYKIWLIAILLAGVCFLTYLFHTILGIGTVVTHFFYIPIILASLWWRKKGLIVAVFSSSFLIFSHFVFFRPDAQDISDYFRAPIFIIIAFVVAILSEHIKEEKEDSRKSKIFAENLVTSMKDGFSILDNKGVHLNVNKALCQMTGFKREDLIGVGVPHPYWPEEEYQKIERAFKKTLQGKFEDFELMFKRKNGERFPVIVSPSWIKDEKGNIISYFATVKDITERKKMEEEVRYKGSHDELTGLYNRAFFKEEMKRLNTKRQLPLSVIMGDTNGLKLINDAFGHPRGDKLLCKIAQVLKSACRKEDVVARWGGDEFAILLPQTDEKTATEVCTRIQKVCHQADKEPVFLSIALGTATKVKPSQNLAEIIIETEDRMYTNKLLDERSIRSAIISSLQTTLAERSYETQEHTQRLQKLAVRTGHRLGLSKGEADLLELLAVLHDIGKVAISNHILKKPGPLSPKEWKEIKKHSEIGYRIAKSSPELASVAEAIWAHHEWWNGKGYPRGLKGEEIPLISRIINIIDAYDVMVHSERPYKKRLSSKEALEELKKGKGSQFDPQLVKVFVEMMSRSER